MRVAQLLSSAEGGVAVGHTLQPPSNSALAITTPPLSHRPTPFTSPLSPGLPLAFTTSQAARSSAASAASTQRPKVASEPVPPSPLSLSPPPAARSDELTVLSWNLCAIAHPFKAPTPTLALGVLLGCDWSDVDGDVPLDAQGPRARRRWLQQAEYIRSSRADLVMLQVIEQL